MRYNPPGNPIHELASRMAEALGRHAPRFLRHQLSAPLPLDALVPPPGVPSRPPGSMPLAPIRAYSIVWATALLTRLAALAPKKKQDSGAGAVRVGTGSRRRSSQDSDEDSDEDGSDGEDDRKRRRSASSQPEPPPRTALPTLPYGFYINSGRAPVRFMNMPSRRNGGICTVEQLRPDLIPDWQERIQLWHQLRPGKLREVGLM